MRLGVILGFFIDIGLAALIDIKLPINHSADVGYKFSFPLHSVALRNELTETAEYCSIAYCIPSGTLSEGDLKSSCPISSCINSIGEKKVVYLFQQEVSGLIIQDDTNKEIIIVFKGTTTDQEWVIDFDTKYQAYTPYSVANEMSKERFTCDGCIVHKGFYEATRVFLEQAFPIVLTLKKDLLSYTIKVTGHSLGAALALLAANELRLLNLDVTLITLAGPKVGDSKFSEWMDRFWNTDPLISNLKDARGNKFPLNTFTRVTNHQDIIPLAPLAAMGFAHCGCEIRIGEGMELSVRGKWTYIHEAQDLKAVSKFLENITEYGQWESAINRKDLMARHAYYFLKVNECIHK